VEIPGVPVGQIARKGEIEVLVQSPFGILGVLGIAVENPATGGQPVPEYVQHILARVPVVDDHRQLKPSRHVQLGDEKFNLGLFITKFAVIIQADLPYGHNPGKLDVLFNYLRPVPAGILDLRRGNTYGMVHIRGGFEVIIDLHKIMKAVTYRHKSPNRSLAGFLDNNELLDRVLTNEPYMGVSIKILHGLVQRNGIGSFPNWMF
jgi:hypothetical protein